MNMTLAILNLYRNARILHGKITIEVDSESTKIICNKDGNEKIETYKNEDLTIMHFIDTVNKDIFNMVNQLMDE